MKLSSRIDVPDNTSVPAGTVTLAGIAWYQHVGVSAVEIQINNGPWTPAEFAAGIGNDTWRQWRLDWTATPGTYQRRVRAHGAKGTTQIGTSADVAPDGATGYDQRQITVH